MIQAHLLIFGWHFYFFLQANWYKSAKFCNYHGMQLASIESQIENDQLEKHIKEFGM
jgi:hypothetical protein